MVIFAVFMNYVCTLIAAASLQDCTVLGFVLDQLLPQCQTAGDKDCPALSRVFVASIASCNHCPEAQNTLVSEIKGSLQRALNVPESSEKHSRIQALTGIIGTVIDACPVPGQIPNQVFKGQQNIVNNMVKILIKRGVVTDLARIPHNLDLSSPYLASTVNAALKPLETLSRAVNQPMPPTPASKTRSANGAHSQGQAAITDPLSQAAGKYKSLWSLSLPFFPISATSFAALLLWLFLLSCNYMFILSLLWMGQ